VWSTVSFAGVLTTKIRVSISSALAGYSRVTEIEAYGWESGPVLPVAPTLSTATAGNAQVALNWTAVPGATSYSVKRGTVSGGEVTLMSVTAPATSYLDASA